ncbi:MAG TPA: restriction endonuclease subunit S [Planctomycetaceae bacterium]|nr:restriction endonuclease subunit S [Planctomycetaceae bacterium]
MSEQSVKESRGSYLADAAKELVAAASEKTFDAAAFFEKFELLADIPDVIGRLRNLFLTLAVSGQLVPQFPSEGDSSESLSHARDERKKLVSSGSIKRRAIASVEDTEAPFAIPASWRWARLVDVGHELGQKTPSDVFTYIDVGGIDSFPGRVSDRVEILEASEAPSRARKVVKRGTVIYSTVRPYLLNVAIVERDYVPEPIASTAFGILHPFSVALSKYLFYWLRSPAFTDYVEAGMKGMAYPAINDEKFYAGLIPLPPLAEQKRIVAKVDELMGLCDRLEALEAERKDRHASLSRAALARFAASPTPANLQFLFHKSFDVEPKELRRSILTLAVQGKLTTRSTKDEPVARKHLREAKDETLHPIPDEWVWTFWEDVLSDKKTGFKRGPFGSSLRKSDFVASGYKVYEQYCPINDDCSFERYYITQDKFESMKGFAVQAGDFLVSCSGVTLGRITQVPAIFTPGIINQALLRVRIAPSILDSLYFKMLFRSPFFQERIFANSTGSAIPNVKGVKELKAMAIPVPPLAEQKRIVAKVEELMALVDQLEQQLANSRTLGQQLLEAVVDHLTNATGQTEAV